MPDKIDALYDALKADGAVTKSREHFREYISDGNNRRKLYEALKADGAIQSSNFTEFDNRLGYGSVTAPTTAYRAKAAQPQVKAPAKAPKKQSGGSRLSRATANAKAGATPRYDVFGWAKGTMAKIKQAKREKREGSFLGRILNKAEDATKAARRQKAAQAQAQTKPKQVTAEQATADLWNTVARGNAMMGGLHDRAEAMKEYQRQGWRDKSGRVATVGGVHSDVRKGKSRFNPETGKMEERWITPTGEVYGSEQEADIHSMWQEHPEILEKDMARRSLNEEGLAGDINRALNARAEELAEIDRKRQAGRSFGQQMIHGLANAEAGPSGGYNSEYLNDLSADPATRQLRAAKALMDDAKDIVNEADIAAKEGKYAQWLDSWSFLKGAGRGFMDKVGKVSTWDFGISDVLNGREIKNALDKFDKGKKLTKSEEMLLEALATKTAVDGYFGSELGRGYKAGGVTAEALPFMLEMAANPLSKAGGAAAKAFSKWVAKKYGVKMGSKLLGQTMKVAGRGGAKATEKAVTKGTRALLRSGEFAVTQGGNVLGATGMALTSGQGRVQADMLRRQQGEVAPVLNQETGNFEIGGREYGEDGLKAYMKALVNTGIEDYTEMMGVGVGKGFGKARAKLFNKMGLSKVNGWIDKIGSSGLARGLDDFLSKTQWHGPIGEYFEEVAGNVLNAALVHDMEFSTAKDKGVFNLDDNIDTFLGVALMGGVFSTIKTLGYVPSRRAAKRRLDFADRMCQQQMGTDWGAISASLTGTDEQIQQVLSDVMKSTDYNQQQKQAVLNYAYALQNAKGVEVGAEKLKAEMTPEQVAEQDAEEQGYNTEGDAEMRTNKLRYDNAVEQLQQSGLDMSEVEAMAADGSIYRVLGMNTFDEAQTNAVKEWLMARASYNGMISRVQDDIDDEVATAQQEVEARIAKQDQGGDGMIHPAVLKLGDRQVDIVGGNVVMHEEDGSIDTNKSDKDLLVRDTQTGKVEMVNINDLARAEAPIDAQQLLAETRANIENARANEVGDKIDGTVQVGGTYTITDEQQKQHTLTVLEDNGDGNLVVQEEGGEPFAMNREQLQSLVDASARQQLAAQQAADNAQLTMQNAQSDAANEEQSPRSETASEEIVSDLNAPMPTKEVDGKQRVDYNRATPERAAHHIYNEKGYSEEEADEMVANTIAKKQKTVEEKAKALDEANAEVAALEGVRPTTPLTEETEDEYNAEKAQIEARRSEAQARAQQANQELEQALQEVTHWEAIRDAASQLGENAQSIDNAQSTMHNAQLEQPVEETPAPTQQSEQPVANEEAPTQQSEQPTASEEQPTANEEQPAASEEAPQVDSEAAAATKRNRERIEKVRAQIKAKVEKLAQACAIPSHVIESEADLDKYPKRISNAVRAQLKQGKRVRGFYDPKSGHMFFYLPGLASEKDADETFAHEAVAHGGLRLLLNDQAAFDELCDNVWNLMSVEDQARYMNYVGVRSLEDMTQENKRAAADEYMAHLSDGQQQNSTSTVKKVLRAISEMIQKVFKKRGINLDIKSDEDIMALLKASRRNLSEVDKEAIKEEIGDALESEDGSDSDRVLMSTVSIFEGAGFEAEQIDENGNSVPMTDAEGNMVVKMGGKEFSAKNPIKASDLNVKAGEETSVLQMLVNDAKEVNNLSEKRAKKIYQNYADILNMYLRMGSAEMGGPDAVERNWQWLGETVYRTIAANGDAQYSYSMDIIKVCKKNEAVIKAMSAHQLLSGRGATPSEIVEIYRKTYTEGFQVPCLVCYVFTRYIRNGKYASAAIRGMETYGEHLPGGSDVWTVKQWLDELDRLNRLTNSKYEPKGKESEEEKEARVKEAKRYENALADANEITVVYEKRINALSYELTSGVSKEREKEIMDEIKVMDARYQGAIDVISFQALTNWIKTFAIEEKSKKWRMREDARKPEDMNDFRANALDLRLTANTMVNYPAIQRLRKSGGSAAGKEITFASNNELGEVVSGLGINKTNLGLYANPYQQFLAATDPKEKEKLRKKAQDRFRDASVYAAMQTLRGGQRMWSWSDNIERLSPDIAINLIQLELLDGAMQTYSKQLEGVKLTAQMGAYVNGSLMAKDNGFLEVSKDEVYERDGQLWLKEDKTETVEEPQVGGEVVPRERVYAGKGSHVYQAKDGKLYVLQYDDVIGIDPFGNRTIKDKDGNDKKAKGLFELNDELDKAGNILVGMNDLHIRAALADPRVFFVIPWHSSGANNHILAEMFAILGQRIDSSVDYQSMQEEKNMGSRDKDSKKLPAVTQRLRDLWNEGKKWAKENGWTSGMEVDSDGDLLTEDQYMYRQLRALIFNGTIFEEMPSEEKYNEAVETYESLDEQITAWENQKEGADAETKKWLDKQIEKARPKRNAAQHIIELHDGLIDWRDSDVNKNDEHWQRHHPKRINVEEARAMVLGDEFLNQVYGRVEPIGHMTNGDNTYIYPYEYWDESSTYDTADINGKRYVEYCRRMGYKPKFSGDWKTKDESKQNVGNFVHDPGYWKLLIDRRMYDRAGKYQWLDPVSSEDFNTDLINPMETQHEFHVTTVADDAAADSIASKVFEEERRRSPNGFAYAQYTKPMDQVLDDFEDAMAGNVRFSTDDRAIEDQEGDEDPVDQPEGKGNSNGIRLSVSDAEAKTLMGVHNITADKLKSAIGLGGLANPSMAVVDTTKGMLNNFGEISLIPSSSLIEAKSGRNAGTWAADAYTPRFPKVHKRLGKGGDKKLKQWLDGLGMRQEMKYNTQDQFNDYYNGFDIQDNVLVYPFLFEKGLTDAVDTYDHNKVSAPYRALISEYKGDIDALMGAFENNDDVRQQVTDIVVDDIVREGVERQEGESFSDWKKRRRALRKEISESFLDMAGYLNSEIARGILKEECAKYVEGSRFNPEETRQASSIYIDKNGMREEYNKYREKKLGELGAEKQMYAGSDSQGRSKFKPITLEGVSKDMKKQGRAGAESGFGSGPGAVRARVTPRLNTLKQIRSERGRIQNDIDRILESYNEEFFNKARYIFNGNSDALGDVLAANDMRAETKKYGYELEDSTIKELRDFRDRIASLPTEYFETKFERPVALNEFEAAIVPNDVDPEIREALEEAGLGVKEYDPEVAGDRERVTLEAANEAGNVLFSTKSTNESLGAPWQGSKGRHAMRLIEKLPGGKRFVDLFAGGGAMTHGAIVSGKYDSYLMNDVNPTGMEMFMQGARGDWDNYDRESMTPEEFAQVKGTPEGMVWSYGGLGRNVDRSGVNARRAINRMKRLGELKPEAGKIATKTGSYKDVKLKQGDVVYADLPYEGTDTRGYGNGSAFDKEAFNEWAQKQNVPVYVSETVMPEGWTEIDAFSASSLRGKRTEKLWVQDKFAEQYGPNSVEDIDAPQAEAEANNLLFSVVEDPIEIAMLEDDLNRNGFEVRYRAMVKVGDGYVNPMASKLDGKMRPSLKDGKWEKSEEQNIEFTPEMLEQMAALDAKDGGGYVDIIPGRVRYIKDNKAKAGTKGRIKFHLVKSNGKDLWAAYNPYLHSSDTPLNDQFKEAWNRPDMVVVKVLVPKSDIESGYKAEHAKDKVGNTPWHSGTVNSALPKEEQRTVTLSRYSKIMGEVSDSEAADMIAKKLKKYGVSVPFNTVTPSLREALVERGVQITEPEKKTGKECAEAYEAWKAEKAATLSQHSGQDRLRFSVNNIDELKDKVLIFFHDSVAGIEQGKGKSIGKLTKEGKTYLESVSGLKMKEDVDFLLNPSDLRHIHNEHYGANEKDKGNNEPLTDDDIRNMVDVIVSPERVIYGINKKTGNKVFVFLSSNPNGTYNLAEIYTDRRGNLTAKSFYNTKKTVSQRVNELLTSSPHLTSATEGASSSSSTNVPTLFEIHKKSVGENAETTEKSGGPKSNYEVIKEAREMVSGEKQPFSGYVSSEYYRGETEDGEPYVIRVSDHPAKKDNFDLYEDNEGKVLSLVFTDDLEGDFEEWKKRFEGINDDEWEEMEQIIFDSKTIDLDKLRDGINYYKKIGKTSGLKESGEFVSLDNAGNSVRFSTVEAVGALRDDERVYNGLLGKVFSGLSEGTRRGIVSDAIANRDYDFGAATGAWLSGLADDETFGNVPAADWKNVKRALRDVLREQGVEGPMSDNEARYVLWSAVQADDGVFSKAADVVMRERLGIGEETAPVAAEPQESGLRFSTVEDEAEEGYDAGPATFEESVTGGLLKAASDNSAALSARVTAMRALGGNLSKLRRAMAQQRQYDRKTVDAIVRLAKQVLNSGIFKGLSRYEVNRLIGMVNRAAGREDITKQAGEVVDMLLQHQMRECAEMLRKQISIRGSKINAKGVEVQGALDIEGQRMVQALKEGMDMTMEELDNRIGEVQDRMGSNDKVTADNAAIEMQGLLLAKQYLEDIKGSEAEERMLKQELKVAEEDKKAGALDKEAYKQFVKEAEEALRENKLERTEAYARLMDNLGDGLKTSIERAKAWREANERRVQEIQHDANSDLQGMEVTELGKQPEKRGLRHNIVRLLMQPVATANEMFRDLGRKHVNGEGNLWKRFIGGWRAASDREFKKLKEAQDMLAEKVSAVMGKKMRWSDLFSMERKMEGMEVEMYDGKERKSFNLSQGNMLYIYMVNKMTDGKMKLRRMGITEDQVEAIAEKIDPRFKELADWIQEEFLVNKREEYNEVYERMFGAPMAAIENYFPLKINSRSRGQQEDAANYLDDENIGSTITGSVIKRVRNSAPLDITGTDAFDLVLEHLQQMEHWAAYAELNRDLGTLLSYKRFRNRLKQMKSVRFGTGEEYWQNFKVCCAILSGNYRARTRRNGADEAVTNIAKGITASKIAFRLYTAFKQLLSSPAYLSEASIGALLKNNPLTGAPKAWNWAIKELPGFAERWQSRISGDSRLMDTDSDWKWWHKGFVEKMNKWGMSPNAFVDAVTVSCGARAMYETKYKQYKKKGFSDEEAKKQALRDASISYNETQQSSEAAFVSAIQLDRTVASVALTVFRNCSMGYQRRLLRAMKNLQRRMQKGYKEESIEYMSKQLARELGIEDVTQLPAEAVEAVKKEYNKRVWRDMADVAIFGWVLQFAWNLGPYLVYLIGGDDDDDKLQMLEDSAIHALFGSVEGLAGGQTISDTAHKIVTDGMKSFSFGDINLLPMMSDMTNMLKHFKSDWAVGATDLVNFLIQSNVGVNPQTLSDFIVSIADACNGDMGVMNEAAFVAMRALQFPGSQLDKLFLDELGITKEGANGTDAQTLATRYAKYRKNKNAPLFGLFYSDEQKSNAMGKGEGRFKSMIREKLGNLSEEDLLNWKSDDEYLNDIWENNVKKIVPDMSDEGLRKVMETSDNATVRSKVSNEIAKRVEPDDKKAKNPYGSNDAKYNQVYAAHQTWEDVAEDEILSYAIRRNKESDPALSKKLDSSRKRLTEIRKRLANGYDEEIMNAYREARRQVLEDNGLMK